MIVGAALKLPPGRTRDTVLVVPTHLPKGWTAFVLADGARWRCAEKLEHRTSNIEHPTSNIQHPTSNVQHPILNIEPPEGALTCWKNSPTVLTLNLETEH
jgi:hypothetical protein